MFKNAVFNAAPSFLKIETLNATFTFPKGLIGFEKYSKFSIQNIDQEPFYQLQCIDNPNLSFIVINPSCFKPNYIIELTKKDFEDIGFTNCLVAENITKDLLHFGIVTIPKDNVRKMTVNLLGPLIINTKTCLGKQALSLNEKFTTKHLILDELEGGAV